MIEMIAGVFGYPVKDEHGNIIRIKGMGPADGPFSVAPEREAELVAKGVARYVEAEENTADPGDEYVPDDAPIGFDEMPTEDTEDDDEEDEAEIVTLSELNAKELRELGKEYGLTFKANEKKTNMIEAIEAAQRELAAATDDAPTFDPTGAVEV